MQEALGLKVSQFVQLMGDQVQSESEALQNATGGEGAHSHPGRAIGKAY